MAVKKVGGKLFTVSDRFNNLKEDEDNNPILEENVRTFRLTRASSKKYVLYEVRRKKSPLRIKTIVPRKKERLADVVSRIQRGDIFLKSKNVISGTNRFGRWESVQTNYYTRLSLKPGNRIKDDTRAKIQIIGLVAVKDDKRQILDYFVGYSKGIVRRKPDVNMLRKAESEVIDMAIAKFISKHGLAGNSDDLTAEIIVKKYQQWRIYEKRR